jgi:hypothetical protein
MCARRPRLRTPTPFHDEQREQRHRSQADPLRIRRDNMHALDSPLPPRLNAIN